MYCLPSEEFYATSGLDSSVHHRLGCQDQSLALHRPVGQMQYGKDIGLDTKILTMLRLNRTQIISNFYHEREKKKEGTWVCEHKLGVLVLLLGVSFMLCF